MLGYGSLLNNPVFTLESKIFVYTIQFICCKCYLYFFFPARALGKWVLSLPIPHLSTKFSEFKLGRFSVNQLYDLITYL